MDALKSGQRLTCACICNLTDEQATALRASCSMPGPSCRRSIGFQHRLMVMMNTGKLVCSATFIRHLSRSISQYTPDTTSPQSTRNGPSVSDAHG
ncbi:hypothetical protein VTJ04DRAFT_3726 [Mycothermus thermophilus]|uniref:uncharacterized protein n=1 Tax=Humicola insolens TaxID=85995 RepID=UPI0037449F64